MFTLSTGSYCSSVLVLIINTLKLWLCDLEKMKRRACYIKQSQLTTCRSLVCLLMMTTSIRNCTLASLMSIQRLSNPKPTCRYLCNDKISITFFYLIPEHYFTAKSRQIVHQHGQHMWDATTTTTTTTTIIMLLLLLLCVNMRENDGLCQSRFWLMLYSRLRFNRSSNNSLCITNCGCPVELFRSR